MSSVPVRNSRAKTSVLVLLVLSAFSPYLFGSVRAEQLIVYALFVAALLANGASGWSKTSPGPVLILVVTFFPVVVSLISLLGSPPYYGSFRPGNVWASLDNQLLPIAVIVVIWSIIGGLNRGAALDSVGTILMWAMAVNAILAIGQWSTILNVDQFSGFYNGTGVQSVAERAAGQYRYTGIFNQPAEAGVMYSLALLAGIRAILERTGRGIRVGVLLALVVIGGLLSVSKIFVYGGLVAVVVVLLVSLGSRRGRGMVVAGVVFAVGVSWLSTRVEWGGLETLRALVGPQIFGLNSVSAGRYGEGSTLIPVVELINREAPLEGLGVRGIANYPYDSLVVQALVYAGWLGALSAVVLFAVLARRAALSRNWLTRNDRILSVGILIVIFSGSFGLPVLSANRVAVVIWTYLSLLLVLGRPSGAVDASGDKLSPRSRRVSLTLRTAREGRRYFASGP